MTPSDVDTRVMPNFDLEEMQPSDRVPARIEPDARGFDDGPRPTRLRDMTPPIETERVVVRWSRKDNVDDVAELFAALAEAQLEDGYGDVERSQTARVSSRKGEGSSYTYDYETLADVIAATRPHLAKHGLACVQFPFPGARAVTIRTMITHKTGQWLYNDLSAVIPMPDPQAVGSAITYLRRYAMKAILNVAASDEDDDGKSASQPQRQQVEPPPRPARRASEQPQERPLPPAAQTSNPSPIGTVLDVVEFNGAASIKLDTGFRCSTKNVELIRALHGYKTNGARVELTCRASSDPSKYLPILEEVTQQRG